jgi:cytochrome c-type biogenesis protein CcmF
MNNIQYQGEHLKWGMAGNLFIMLAFSAALLSCISYFIALRNTPETMRWQRMGKVTFFVHAFSIFSVIGILIYLIFNHYFEYYYVWQHSNLIMPMRYIFACLWEGQEGSFLLWIFWHIILCFFLIRKKNIWQTPTMAIIMSVQVFLCSMILGVYILNYKIGTNPFILLREHPDFAGLPFVSKANYLSLIDSGRGLNPLLQNYWMVIHPPVLFLGFAATVVPFAYALGGLMKGKVSEWIKPAMPWAFFGMMVLGTGILMGAAWAYESLSFGGFWAWDPVENASLVPWITLVAASHVMIIYNHRGHSLFSVFLLTITAFLLVLYSTFLTRSGILGETSVHAFTDLGMSGQLIIYMAFFVVLAVVLLIRERKKIIFKKEDDSITSREFWMYIGALVLVISALQITFTTSIPVINKIFSVKLAPPAESISHYNAWQIPIATVICVLIAIGQFLKFKKTGMQDFNKKIIYALVISVLAAALSALFMREIRPQYIVMLFAAVFAVTANADYFLRVLKGNTQKAGASTAHIGFSLILMGALISNSQKQIISQNVKGINLGKDFSNRENIMLELHTDTLPMGDYFIRYNGKTREGVNLVYSIEYYKENPVTGKKEKKFELHPIVQLNERMGNVSEPSTKRFLSKDIYTHITYVDPEDLKVNKEMAAKEEYAEPVISSLFVGDTISRRNCLIVLTGLNTNMSKNLPGLEEKDIAVGAQLIVFDMSFNRYQVEPVFVIRGNVGFPIEATLDTLGLKFNFTRLEPQKDGSAKVELAVSEKKSHKKEFIIMKAIVFPGINILWLGCFIFIFGMLLTIRKRIRKLRMEKNVNS